MWHVYGWILIAGNLISLATAYQEPCASSAGERSTGRLIALCLVSGPVAGHLIGWW